MPVITRSMARAGVKRDSTIVTATSSVAAPSDNKTKTKGKRKVLKVTFAESKPDKVAKVEERKGTKSKKRKGKKQSEQVLKNPLESELPKQLELLEVILRKEDCESLTVREVPVVPVSESEVIHDDEEKDKEKTSGHDLGQADCSTYQKGDEEVLELRGNSQQSESLKIIKDGEKEDNNVKSDEKEDNNVKSDEKEDNNEVLEPYKGTMAVEDEKEEVAMELEHSDDDTEKTLEAVSAIDVTGNSEQLEMSVPEISFMNISEQMEDAVVDTGSGIIKKAKETLPQILEDDEDLQPALEASVPITPVPANSADFIIPKCLEATPVSTGEKSQGPFGARRQIFNNEVVNDSMTDSSLFTHDQSALSTYDITAFEDFPEEDRDDKAYREGKFIPSWAQGEKLQASLFMMIPFNRNREAHRHAFPMIDKNVHIFPPSSSPPV